MNWLPVGEVPFCTGQAVKDSRVSKEERSREPFGRRGTERPGEDLGMYLEPWMPAGASERRHAPCPLGLSRERQQRAATGMGGLAQWGLGGAEKGPSVLGVGHAVCHTHSVCCWAGCGVQ